MSDQPQSSPGKKAVLETLNLHQRKEFDEAVTALSEARRSRKGHKTALSRATKAAKWINGQNTQIAVGLSAHLGDDPIDSTTGEMVEMIL